MLIWIPVKSPAVQLSSVDGDSEAGSSVRAAALQLPEIFALPAACHNTSAAVRGLALTLPVLCRTFALEKMKVVRHKYWSSPSLWGHLRVIGIDQQTYQLPADTFRQFCAVKRKICTYYLLMKQNLISLRRLFFFFLYFCSIPVPFPHCERANWRLTSWAPLLSSIKLAALQTRLISEVVKVQRCICVLHRPYFHAIISVQLRSP